VELKRDRMPNLVENPAEAGFALAILGIPNKLPVVNRP